MRAASMTNTTWQTDLSEITLDRSRPRAGLRSGPGGQFASSLVGFDCRTRGGLTPSTGFKKVHDLDFYADSNHDTRSVVTDSIPVDFRRGSTDYCYGFVYRVKRPTAYTTADIFLDYWDSETETWSTGNKIGDAVDPDAQMDVATFGRLNYVFIKGRSPILFYLNEESVDPDGTSTWSPSSSDGAFTLRILGDTGLPPLPGPGIRCTLTSPESSGPLGSLFSTGDGNRPGAGQIVLTETGPASLGLFTELLEDNLFLFGDEASSSNILLGADGFPRIIWQSDCVGAFDTTAPVEATVRIFDIPITYGDVILVQAITIAASPSAPTVALEEEDGTATGTFLTDNRTIVTSPDGTTRQQWFWIHPAATGTFRVKVSSTTDARVAVSAVVARGCNISNIVTARDTSTHEVDPPNTGFARPGTSVVSSDGQLYLHGITVSSTSSDADTRFNPAIDGPIWNVEWLTESDVSLSVPKFGIQGRHWTGVSSYALSVSAGVDGPVRSREWTVSTIQLNDAAVEATSSDSSSSSSSSYGYTSPTRIAQGQATSLTDNSITITGVEAQEGDWILVWTYVKDGTADNRATEVYWGTDALYNKNPLNTSDPEAYADNTDTSTRLGVFWCRVMGTGTNYGAGTKNLVLVADEAGTRDEIGISYAVLRACTFNQSSASAASYDQAFDGPVRFFSEQDTGEMTRTLTPADNGRSHLLTCVLFSSTDDTITAENTEWWSDATTGVSRFFGEYFEAPAGTGATTMGGSLPGGSSASSAGTYDTVGVHFSIQGGEGAGGTGGANFAGDFFVTLLSPGNGRTNVGLEPTLKWDGRYIDGRPATDIVYDVYMQVEGETDSLRKVTTTTEEEYEAGKAFSRRKLPYNTTIRWQVKARISGTTTTSDSEEWTFTTIDAFDARKLEPGDYVFGYVLYDRRTGRMSTFSEVAQCGTGDFPVTANNDTTRKSAFAAIEIVYDSDKYDQAWIYRSVKAQEAGGTYSQTFQHLDRIINLTTYHTTNNGDDKPLTDDQPLRQAVYYYQLEDKQLVWKESYGQLPVYDATLPRGGAAAMYQNILMVGAVSGKDSSDPTEVRQGDAFSGLGEMRWSQVHDLTPELFPPRNRYTPSTPANEIIALEPCGGSLLAFSRDRLYHTRREGGQLLIKEMHEGRTGPVSHKAVTKVGSAVFVVTEKGLVSVDSFAKMDHIHALDDIINRTWLSTHSSISLAFDPRAGILFGLNSAREEAFAIWFTTSQLSEFVDLPFSEVRTGAWPIDTSGYTGDRTQRALFLKNVARPTDGTETPGDPKPSMWVYDFDLTKTSGPQTLDPGIGPYLTVVSTQEASSSIDVSSSSSSSSGPYTDDVNGCYIYILDGTAQGEKLKVWYYDEGDGIFYCTTTLPDGLEAGDTIGLSPMYWRVVTPPLDERTNTGQPFGGVNPLSIKQVNSCRAIFVDVTGASSAPFAYYRGLAYRGSSDEATDARATYDTSGNTLVKSIAEDGSKYKAVLGAQTDYARKQGVSGGCLASGVDGFCPQVGFTLLAMTTEGKIQGTEFREAPNADAE